MEGAGLFAWLDPAAVPGAGLLVWWWLRRRQTGRAHATTTDPDAVTALAAHREGRLEVDTGPAGEVLRQALHDRLAIDEDASPDEVRRADGSLGRSPAGTPRIGSAAPLARRGPCCPAGRGH